MFMNVLLLHCYGNAEFLKMTPKLPTFIQLSQPFGQSIDNDILISSNF